VPFKRMKWELSRSINVVAPAKAGAYRVIYQRARNLSVQVFGGEGGMVSYGIDLPDLYRRSASCLLWDWISHAVRSTARRPQSA
jgi:hypothetical protein